MLHSGTTLRSDDALGLRLPERPDLAFGVPAAPGLVEGGDRAQRGAAERGEAGAGQLGAGGRPQLAADLQQSAGEPGAVDLALLGDGERERAPRPLGGGALAAGVLRRLGAGGGSTVRTKPIGGWSRPLDHGTTQGLRDFADARSPSTSTPSISDGSALRAQARAPAAPPDPPEVDTSTSVRRRSRPISCGRPGSSVPSASLARVRKMRASSSSAAVPESSASPGEAAESRCASTTIRRGESPGRIPSTVSISASPSIVRPVVVSRRTSMPEASNKPATRSASARSPLEPGRRSGNAAPSSSSESRARSLPYARAGSKASATARVRTGEGRLCNENATTNTAMSAGRNAVL